MHCNISKNSNFESISQCCNCNPTHLISSFQGPLQISQLLRCESGFLCHTHFRFQIARDDYLDDRFMMTSGFCPDIENRYNLTRREGEAPTLHSSCCHMSDAGSETKQDLILKVDFNLKQCGKSNVYHYRKATAFQSSNGSTRPPSQIPLCGIIEPSSLPA